LSFADWVNRIILLNQYLFLGDLENYIKKFYNGKFPEDLA